MFALFGGDFEIEASGIGFAGIRSGAFSLMTRTGGRQTPRVQCRRARARDARSESSDVQSNPSAVRIARLVSGAVKWRCPKISQKSCWTPFRSAA